MAPYSTGEPRNRWWGAAAARRPLVGWPAFGAVLSPLPRPAPAPPACGTGRFPLRAACAGPALLHFPAGGGIRGRAGVPCVRSGLRPAPPSGPTAQGAPWDRLCPCRCAPRILPSGTGGSCGRRRGGRACACGRWGMWGIRGIDRCGRHAVAQLLVPRAQRRASMNAEPGAGVGIRLPDRGRCAPP